MPTLIGHAAMPLFLAMIGGRKLVSIRLGIAAIAAAILLDLDAIGFRFDIPYAHMMGHRGFSHSIAFALIVGSLGILAANRLQVRKTVAFPVLFLSTLSHSLLDAMTTGGLGVAFFSPFSNERYFLPWRIIEVSPLSISRFISGRGCDILRSEILWLWIPAMSMGALGIFFRKKFRRSI